MITELSSKIRITTVSFMEHYCVVFAVSSLRTLSQCPVRPPRGDYPDSKAQGILFLEMIGAWILCSEHYIFFFFF